MGVPALNGLITHDQQPISILIQVHTVVVHQVRIHQAHIFGVIADGFWCPVHSQGLAENVLRLGEHRSVPIFRGQGLKCQLHRSQRVVFLQPLLGLLRQEPGFIDKRSGVFLLDALRLPIDLLRLSGDHLGPVHGKGRKARGDGKCQPRCRRDAPGSVNPLPLLQAVKGGSQHGSRHLQQRVPAQKPLNLRLRRPSGIRGQYLAGLAAAHELGRIAFLRLSGGEHRQNPGAVVILQERVDLQLYPGRRGGLGRADHNEPSGIFQGLPDLTAKIRAAGKLPLIHEYPPEGLSPLSDVPGCPIVFQRPLECYRRGAVDGPVLVAHESVIFHRLQLRPVGLQGLQNFPGVRQHFLSGVVSVLRRRSQGLGKILLHRALQMPGDSSAAQLPLGQEAAGAAHEKGPAVGLMAGEQIQGHAAHAVQIRLRPQPKGAVIALENFRGREAGAGKNDPVGNWLRLSLPEGPGRAEVDQGQNLAFLPERSPEKYISVLNVQMQIARPVYLRQGKQ